MTKKPKPLSRRSLLTPKLRRLASQRQAELAKWEKERKLDLKTRRLLDALIEAGKDLEGPPDISEHFRSYLYGTSAGER